MTRLFLLCRSQHPAVPVARVRTRRSNRILPGALPGAAALCLATALCLGVMPARAQTETVAVYDRFAPAFDDDGFLSLQGTVTPGPWRAALTLGSDLSFAHDQVPREGGRVRLDRVFRSTLGVQVGLGERMAVAVAVPVILIQLGEAPFGADGAREHVDTRRDGFGDVRLQGRYRLFGSVAQTPGDSADGPGLGMLVGFDLPTGDAARYTGEGLTRTELSLLADFQLLGAAAGLKLGWLRRPIHRVARPDGDRYKLQDRFLYGVGLRIPMPFMPTLSAIAELRGEADFADSRSAPLELLLGGRIKKGPWSATLSGGLRLSSGFGVPAGRVVLTVRATPKNPDIDGDGIPDGVDACPLLPEDIDGFEDDDGCEDPDNDNDLVPDADDLCPNEEAAEDRDLDEDGCTDK